MRLSATKNMQKSLRNVLIRKKLEKLRRHLLGAFEGSSTPGEDGGGHYWLGKNSRRHLLNRLLQEKLARRDGKSIYSPPTPPTMRKAKI
jgi:hypothetical protein